MVLKLGYCSVVVWIVNSRVGVAYCTYTHQKTNKGKSRKVDLELKNELVILKFVQDCSQDRMVICSI